MTPPFVGACSPEDGDIAAYLCAPRACTQWSSGRTGKCTLSVRTWAAGSPRTPSRAGCVLAPRGGTACSGDLRPDGDLPTSSPQRLLLLRLLLAGC